MSRRAYNRADNREQEAHDKRIKEGGKKTVYYIGGYDLGKIAYDYANHLKGLKSAEPSKPEQKAEPAKEEMATTKPVDYAKLKGVEVTAKGIREKTGETFEYKEDAATALKDVDDQISVYEKILDCLMV